FATLCADKNNFAIPNDSPCSWSREVSPCAGSARFRGQISARPRKRWVPLNETQVMRCEQSCHYLLQDYSTYMNERRLRCATASRRRWVQSGTGTTGTYMFQVSKDLSNPK